MQYDGVRYFLCSCNQVKHICRGGLDSNLVLEGQKLLGSTVLNAPGVFSNPMKGT